MQPYVTFRIGSSLGCVYTACSGFSLFCMYLGIWSIGPGLYSDTPAIMSSRQSGFSSFMNLVIPALSNWNIPIDFPSCHSLYTFGSFISLSNSTSMPLDSFTRSIASLITVSVLNPKKSILSNPSSSRVVIMYCVDMLPSLTYSGTYVSTGSFVITIPAGVC